MPSTMREDFEDAFKQFDEIGEEESENKVQEAAPDLGKEEISNSHDEDAEHVAQDSAEPESGKSDVQEQESQGEKPDLQSKNDGKAPVSWGISAREQWNTLPEDVKSQVLKREQQIAEALENGKENRKTGERFMDIVNKFQPIISAEGITDPIQGFKGLMETVAGLRLGNQQQKAQFIARFINGYGVDLNVLDQVLASNISGKPVQQTEDQRLAQMLEQKMAPINQFMSNLERQKQLHEQQMQENTNREVESFAQSHEFYQDVRLDMADLIDLAANQGRNLTLEQAYNMACAANPEIQSVIKNRNNMNSIAQKRNAASSISGRKAGNATQAPDSLREALEQAWGS